jgi:hypothetical protein
MAAPNGMHSIQETVKREDILDEIQDISPDENPLTSTLGTEKVDQIWHQWAEMTVTRDSSVASSIEGDDDSFSDLTAATMRQNTCQIIKKAFAVTETEIVINKVSPRDAYARELSIAMRQLKNSMEYSVIRGTKASGSSGVARQMEGFINATNATNGGGSSSLRPSGTSLTETELNDLFVLSWNATDAYVADMILVSGNLKRDISLFTAGNTRNVPADDKRLVRAISVYESDFGLHEIRAHKDMPAASTTTGHGLLMIRKELCKIGYLRYPKHVPIAMTGDAKKGHVVAELTAVARSAKPFVYRGGYRLGL